jgi:hypothetical protein
MNFDKKTIIYGSLLVIAMMGLVPPWKISISSDDITAIRSAYGFILSPPFRGFGEIYLSKLIIQWVIVAIIAYGLMVLLKQKEEHSVKIHCPKCGKEAHGEDKFCSGCGNDISKTGPGTDEK